MCLMLMVAFVDEPQIVLHGLAGIPAAGAQLPHGGPSPHGAALLSPIRTVPLSARDSSKTVISVPAEERDSTGGGGMEIYSNFVGHLLQPQCFIAPLLSSLLRENKCFSSSLLQTGAFISQ